VEKTIYHVCAADDWRTALAGNSYSGSPDDLRDGFMHFSTARQLLVSVGKHRAGQTGLLIVEVESAALGADLRWEVSRGGARFPHLYGPLPLTAVRRTAPLPLGPDGHHLFPDWRDVDGWLDGSEAAQRRAPKQA
jgi:uncharacterized protein (DUF952 family)|tara:strand:+ start:5646 stop:6050 length:405 start_codon:yes stop_codon:yes gene_type:complete